MRSARRHFGALLLGLLVAAGAAEAGPRVERSCHIGAYRHPSGAVLVLAKTGTPAERRFILSDGRTGVLRPQGGGRFTAGPGWSAASPVVATAKLGACQSNKVMFRLADGPGGAWRRVPLRETRTRFRTGDVTLSGTLVERIGGPGPATVLVHGSSETPYVDHEPWQWMLPALGVSVFVYDKRGTGESGGTYTQDFSVLANDAVAAVRETRRIGGGRITRLGLLGVSQGGWIAPLTAARTPVDFVQVGYGVVGTPLEQDQWQVAYELTDAGFGPDVLAKAARLTEAAADVAASDFREGLPAFRRVLDEYRTEPWLHRFEGQYTGLLVQGKVDQARAESPQVPWRYDGISVLRELRIPQFWILAGSDSLAPAAPTLARLHTLRAAGKPIEVAVFPQADHGIKEFRRGPRGRERTRYADGYFRLQADWILGRRDGSYGAAQFVVPAPR